MAERIELTGNIWVVHPDKGLAPIPGADPVDPGAATSYAIKEVDVVTGVQTAKVYGPDMRLLSTWAKPGWGGQWTQVVTAEGALNSQAVPE